MSRRTNAAGTYRIMRMTAVILSLILSLGLMGTAGAEERLPESIQTYFGENYEVMGSAYNDWGKDSCWFVLVRNRQNENILYQFKQKNGVWTHVMHTDRAVPQGKNAVQIGVSPEIWDWTDDRPFNVPVLVIDQMNAPYGSDEIEQSMLSSLYVLEDGVWKLYTIWSYGAYDKMVFGDDRISYYGGVESTKIIGTAYGTVQRDLKYVNLSSVPKTLKEARQKLTSAPALPASQELSAREIQFTGGQKFPVYSAPDASSLRGGNGKAIVSTNGWIQVFGQENGFALIQYSIDSGHYRFGYISADALPKNAGVSALDFHPRAAWLNTQAALTDDPLYSAAPLLNLPKGVPVTWLCTLGSWAYVESDTGDVARGFVPVQYLSTDRQFDLYLCPDDQGKQVYEGTVTVTPQGDMTAVMVIDEAGPLGNAAVGSLRLYDSMTGQLLCTATQTDILVFSGQGQLNAATTSIRITAVDPAGQELSEGTVKIEW